VHLQISRRWVFGAVLLGVLGAYTYFIWFDAVSDWFDGLGQEVFNALCQFGIYLCLLVFNILLLGTVKRAVPKKLFIIVILVATTLAMSREGAEIFLYISSFTSMADKLTAVLTGSLFGASIGFSVGVLIYYGVLNLPHWLTLKVCFGVLSLVAAGMVSQAVRLLIQIDWLPASEPVWNTSDWISETSVTGQLLYALISYESTPSLLEVQSHLAAIGLIIICTILYYWRVQSIGDQHEG